jgi:phosphatidyl-myo-inositol dimannoside synthase
LPDVDEGHVREVRERYDITSVTGPIILTVGEVKHRKGQLDTTRAMVHLKKEYPSVRYLIVGGNRDTDYIEKIKEVIEKNNLEENVKIISDAKDEKTLIAIYKMANVFCLNSNNQGDHFEGFGLVFFEAGQFGVPSIGSSGCGIIDAIKDGYSGFHTKQGDPQDISEKILKVLKGDREKFRTQVKQWSESFTWEGAARKYTREYSS